MFCSEIVTVTVVVPAFPFFGETWHHEGTDFVSDKEMLHAASDVTVKVLVSEPEAETEMSVSEMLILGILGVSGVPGSLPQEVNNKEITNKRFAANFFIMSFECFSMMIQKYTFNPLITNVFEVYLYFF
jgi:hypothetical protein